MGYLFKPKGSKTYYAGYKDANGAWIRKSTCTQYKAAAMEHLKRAELLASKGEMVRRPVPLEAFLSKYLESQRPTLTADTQERYRNCLDNLTAPGSPLAGLPLSRVTVGTCSQYISWRLAHGKHKATVDKEIGWLKAALAEAARQELMSWEAVARIRDEIRQRHLPALRNAHVRRERILWPKEIPILLGAATSNENLLDALIVALWTGLRQQNILSLTEGDVDFTCEPPVIRFAPERMKNKAGHLVRLCPNASTVLWRRWHGNPQAPGRRFFTDFRPAWKRLQAKLKSAIPDFRFHDLRRTYISYRLAAGIDPKTVQDEVGHRDSRMTMDCYGRALRDPGVRVWAVRHFRFSFDPPPPGSELYQTNQLVQSVQDHTKLDVNDPPNLASINEVLT